MIHCSSVIQYIQAILEHGKFHLSALLGNVKEKAFAEAAHKSSTENANKNGMRQIQTSHQDLINNTYSSCVFHTPINTADINDLIL